MDSPTHSSVWDRTTISPATKQRETNLRVRATPKASFGLTGCARVTNDAARQTRPHCPNRDSIPFKEPCRPCPAASRHGAAAFSQIGSHFIFSFPKLMAFAKWNGKRFGICKEFEDVECDDTRRLRFASLRPLVRFFILVFFFYVSFFLRCVCTYTCCRVQLLYNRELCVLCGLPTL